ncbi:MAG: glycosyltransferase [Candidatus Thorarchaeota archaeon]|jgi:glycosyltransferase involved in cell wall biosynthesis
MENIKKQNPKVSIIIPAYNAEKHIEETISSILMQDFEDFEIIAVNDGSSDKTEEVINKLSEKDSRVKLVDKKNGGAASACNEGLKHISGEYVLRIDSDDLMKQRRLSEQTKFLDENPDIDMVYGDVEVLFESTGDKIIKQALEFDRDAREILLEASKREDLGEIEANWLLTTPEVNKFIPAGSVMLRRKVFEECKFDENLRNSEDYDLWFQVIGGGFKIKRLPMIAYVYRVHPEQKSGNPEKMLIAARYINEKLRKGEYFNN